MISKSIYVHILLCRFTDDGAAMGNAAESAVVEGPFRDYGPDGAADGLSRSLSTLRRADDTATRPSGERADASSRCRLFLDDNQRCNRLGLTFKPS